MKNNQEEIDNLIKEALTKEEATFYDELEEQNFIGKLAGVFNGNMGWLVFVMNVVNLVVFALLIYCVIQFFNTDFVNELIKWAIGMLFCILFMSIIKLYVWMQMDKNDILRGLKRIELQVAALVGKVN